MQLDVSSLEKALTQLEKNYAFSCSKDAKKNSDLFAAFRSGAIQAFEFCYERCITMLKRHLEETEPSTENVDILSYRDLIRLGSEKGLLKDPTNWFRFRDKRNLTSHTYAEEKANLVYNEIPRFLENAKLLLSKLKAYHH